jgi:eukaryotic-like serine/threonine-protein kinase
MTELHDLAARWPEINALLDEALALPATDRDKWLSQLSDERASLRDTVARLLVAQASVDSGDFLGTLPKLVMPFTDASGAKLNEPAAGELVGPYRLLSPLGQGGMGAVWLAERSDGQLKRQVALKLPRLVWGTAVAERMARERDILATLSHPHIARLYDAGVDVHGRPYLAMEVVQGQPIDVYCNEHALTVAQRLQLLLQVATAVAHAHARLVVHRDLKPANILVTEEGQVRLLDFGIAKLLEGDHTQETALTRHAGAAMTLDYASPEQIRGDPLTTASDVYSLAVVAYEVLAGARPYRLKRGSAAELEEAIATVEPVLASDTTSSPADKRLLRGDLDAILNKGLKKDAVQRYASVEAFAQDIERYLRGNAVLAQPDTRAYRLRRFIGRNRLPMAAATVTSVALLASAGFASWQAVVARQQAQAAKRESSRAESEVGRQQAVRNLYIDAMTLLSSTAAASSAALAEPHAVTRLLQRQLRELAPRYANRPVEWQAMLEAVTLQLNYSHDFESSLIVGREYLAHLQQYGAEAATVIEAHVVQGSTLYHLRRFDECEAIRRAGLEWAPDQHDERTELARLDIAMGLGSVLVQRGKRTEAEAVLLKAEAGA